MDKGTTTRLDLIKDNEVVLISRKNNKPFKLIEKDNFNKKVKGIWLLTGETVYLSGNEATLPIDNTWFESILEELENKKTNIDKSIKMIKSINEKKIEKKSKKIWDN